MEDRLQLLDDIQDTALDTLADGLDLFEESISRSFPHLEDTQGAVDAIHAFLADRLDETYGGFEEFLCRKVLRKPALYEEEAEGRPAGPSSDLSDQLDGEIAQLRGEIRAALSQNRDLVRRRKFTLNCRH